VIPNHQNTRSRKLEIGPHFPVQRRKLNKRFLLASVCWRLWSVRARRPRVF